MISRCPRRSFVFHISYFIPTYLRAFCGSLDERVFARGMISLAREYRAKRPKGSLAKSTRTRVRRLLLSFRAKEREIEKERGMIRENRASHESFRRGGGKGGLQPSVSFIEISLFQNYHAFQSFQDESDFFLPLSAPTNARERHPRVICREGVRGVVQAFERASRDSISIKVKKRESEFEGARRSLSLPLRTEKLPSPVILFRGTIAPRCVLFSTRVKARRD